MIEHLNKKLQMHHRQTMQNYHVTPLLSWRDALGCSIESFAEYVQTFFAPGMTWENHGSLWTLVRVQPAWRFDLGAIEGQKRFFHFTNVQPEWRDKARSFWKPKVQTFEQKWTARGGTMPELKREQQRLRKIKRAARFLA